MTKPSGYWRQIILYPSPPKKTKFWLHFFFTLDEDFPLSQLKNLWNLTFPTVQHPKNQSYLKDHTSNKSCNILSPPPKFDCPLSSKDFAPLSREGLLIMTISTFQHIRCLYFLKISRVSKITLQTKVTMHPFSLHNLTPHYLARISLSAKTRKY